MAERRIKPGFMQNPARRHDTVAILLCHTGVVAPKTEARCFHDGGVMFRRLFATIALVGILAPPAAAQDVLFGTGTEDHTRSYWTSGYLWAMDFELSSGSTLQGLDLWYLENEGSPGQATPGTMYWQILSSTGGAPGGVLYSGSGTGSLNGIRYYQPNFEFDVVGYTVDLGGLALDGGNYWLTLHNTGGGAMGWTSARYGDDAWYGTVDGGVEGLGRYPYGGDIAFRLTGSGSEVPGTVTPEPVTMLLMGSGLVGVAGAARRRRRTIEEVEVVGEGS